ncbi:MAG TPA: 30S ribosomal protein S15 [Candidatus Nanoarchaeia archaeon]|nr:30S ribosomal protein S15 [Candidatus Nanoarchaeia archaeon]
MARRYSGKKGKAGSHRPITKNISWVRHGPKEIEMIVSKLAKEGRSSAQIGLTLRDSYGIPDSKLVTKKRISQILREKGLAKELPDDLLSLIKRSVMIRKHLEENKKDMSAFRGLQLTESKMRRLVTYYKEKKVLPADWKYDAESIRLYAE